MNPSRSTFSGDYVDCQPDKSGLSSDVELNISTRQTNDFDDIDDDDLEQTTTATLETQSTSAGEMRLVQMLRFALIGVLVVSTVLASSGVFMYTSNAEKSEFQKKYADYSAKVFDAFIINIEQSLYMTDLVSAAYTSYALDRNLTWPFVTLPNFEVLGVRARHLVQSGGAIVYGPVVSKQNREEWEAYAVANQRWTVEASKYYRSHPELNIGDTLHLPNGSPSIPPLIWAFGANNTPTVDMSNGPAVPVWQFAPIGYSPFQVNFNVVSHPLLATSVLSAAERGEATLSKFLTLGQDLISRPSNSPLNIMHYPVFASFDDSVPRKAVGIVGLELYWENFFRQLLPNNANGIVAVLGNTCGQVYTFEVLGEAARYLGPGDLHDSTFDNMIEEMDLSDIQVPGLVRVASLGCPISLRLYPSSTLLNLYITNNPIIYTAAAASIFVFTAIVFFVYDALIKRRHRVLKHLAVRSNAIVTSLFPSMVRDRLFQNVEIDQNDLPKRRASMNSLLTPARRLSLFNVGFEAPKIQLKSFIQDSTVSASVKLHDTLPIADYFPNTTVLFADIAGFTAWCSQREPTQVFILLETIYGAFDAIAKRHGVFKIETIGDCYMAVTGLPDPQDDHALIMAAFASACLKKMRKLTKELEATLGPGTAELCVRIGLHSGPVTAGVLRGEKSRFQLFGDTVNTASRIESNGQPNRAHLSEETAQLLLLAEKDQWIVPRGDLIVAKGKGEMQTYWLAEGVSMSSLVKRVHRSAASDNCDDDNGHHLECKSRHDVFAKRMICDCDVGGEKPVGTDPMKLSRLVDWNTDILLARLKAIVASRQASGRQNKKQNEKATETYNPSPHPRDEVAEIIALPEFDPSVARRTKDPECIDISPVVVSQLRKYVASIAAMYRDNPFHNFEHASHVAMSSNKLLQRVTSPEDVDYQREDVRGKHRVSAVALDLHERTFGITSDTLAHFAIVYSALVHDVDHPGLSNTQIIQQQDPMAIKYGNKSVAEQNSISKARDLLMNRDFAELRQCIYSTESEAKRFWQLVVNSVMATDLFDAELRELRKKRWEEAFQNNEFEGSVGIDAISPSNGKDFHLKATTVIEHIIQASDVVHTMQHWHIYQKWNRRLFHELLTSFQKGMMEKDPSLRWYEGELSFFDNYIVPLAKKLKDCGVFGVSGDEFLNYAQENRKEWAMKGEQIVRDMVDSFHRHLGKQMFSEIQCEDGLKDSL